MKCRSPCVCSDRPESHPSRGAWIEIIVHGAVNKALIRRTPRGVRGLKFGVMGGGGRPNMSHPSRGAWIEIA